MKILYYNWVDYLDDEKRGGGVSVYQKNLMHTLGEEEGVQSCFLSSGISYDLFADAPRWERVRHGTPEDRRRRFEIVNSGVLSPAHHSFGDEAQVDDPTTAGVFFDFIRRNGPFDVVHFNNLEGLPASVLKLKEEWPDTRVILSLHNYYPVCPQVNLWLQERENCRDYEKGRKCETCLIHNHDPRIVRLANAVAFNLKKWGVRPGSRLFDRGFGPAMRVAGRLVRLYRRRVHGGKPAAPLRRPRDNNRLLQRVEASHLKFFRRRQSFVELINTYCDTVLCVSERVGEVAVRFGIAPGLVQTSYIGTRHAEKFLHTQPAPSLLQPDGTVTLGYLGYMRHDKGFFFLLDALEALPTSVASRVRVVIASRLLNQQTMDRIGRLSEHLASVEFANGYTHEQLDDILEGVNVGVIPVLWEDNLPQVAIEMHARHIPLLTSDLGGAQELGNSPDMVFRAGDKADFARRLQAILQGKVDMDAYWRAARHPHSMQEHLDELHAVYQAPVRPAALMPGQPETPRPVPAE